MAGWLVVMMAEWLVGQWVEQSAAQLAEVLDKRMVVKKAAPMAAG